MNSHPKELDQSPDFLQTGESTQSHKTGERGTITDGYSTKVCNGNLLDIHLSKMISLSMNGCFFPSQKGNFHAHNVQQRQRTVNVLLPNVKIVVAKRRTKSKVLSRF